MKHYLILGFFCKIYKKEPLVRLYMNNNLIDEFSLYDNSENANNWEQLWNKHSLDPLINMPVEEIKYLPFYKIIEFEHQNINKLKIDLEILNSDSNYTNGFMTKSTLIMIHKFFVVSEKVKNQINNIEDRYKFNKKSFYKFRSPLLFFQKHISQKQIYCNFAGQIDDYNRGDWIGGDKNFSILLTQKLGFWVKDTVKKQGIWSSGEVLTVKDIFNKYNYENQRNINT